MELRIVEREQDRWHSYTLEALPRGETEYRKATRVVVEGRVEVRDESMTIVNAELAYAIIADDRLAVTTDGGRKWRTWDIDDFLSTKQCDAAWIDSAALNPDGTGLLTFNGLDLGPKPQFVTTDFGRTWTRSK